MLFSQFTTMLELLEKDLKEQAHVIMGTGKSEFCKAGWHAGDLGKG